MNNKRKHAQTGEYHYTESGLENVYLIDGFSFVDGPRGKQVVIQDIDGLHRVIGETLITHRKNLSGKEIKFLRHEMLMSQTTLARLLGVSERAVIRWEGAKAGDVPSPAEASIRMLYRDFIKEEGDGAGEMRKMLKKIADMESEMEIVSLRKPDRARWRPELEGDTESKQLSLTAF